MVFYSFYTFVAVKPTYTSDEKRKISVDDFPDNLICPEPSHDVDALKSRGYGGVPQYFGGSRGFGWSGNKSENLKDVMKEVSTLKSTADCPLGFHRFANDRSRADYSLQKVLYPYHICCRVIAPKISQSNPLTYLNIYFNSSSHYRSFKVFLADPLSTSFYDLHKRIMLGDELVSDENGWMNYNVKIMENRYLEGDPKFPCTDYKIRGEYATCIENEMIEQILPFWLRKQPNKS